VSRDVVVLAYIVLMCVGFLILILIGGAS